MMVVMVLLRDSKIHLNRLLLAKKRFTGSQTESKSSSFCFKPVGIQI